MPSPQGKRRLFHQNKERQLAIRIGDLAADLEVETNLWLPIEYWLDI